MRLVLPPFSRLAVLLSIALALGSGTARAVTAPEDAETRVEIPRPARAWLPDGYGEAPESERLQALARAGLRPTLSRAGTPERFEALRTASRHAFFQLSSRSGVRLDARWDERLGVPHRVRAAGLAVSARDLRTVSAAEAAARAFVRDQSALLTGGETPGAAELPLVSVHRVGQVWFLVFGERWHGLEVVDGRVDVRLRTDGSIPLFGSSWFPAVAALGEPRVVTPVALAVARAGLSVDGREVQDLSADLAVLPVDDADGVSYRLVHRVRQRAQRPLGLWTTYVDAEDGRVWARENALRYVDVSGTVSGAILPYTYTDAFVTGRMPHAVVWRAADSTFADAGGNYLLTGAAPGESLRTAFRSPFLEVQNVAGSNSYLPAAAPGSGPLDFNWTPASSDSAERNAFYQASAAHAYIKALDPGFVGLDYRVPAYININATCNAYWDGASINFYRTGGGCPNTATIADVIFHEYGHGVTQFTFDPFEPNGAMHEGFSDYLAASMTRSSIIGRNFRGPGTHLRDTENSVALPATSCNGEPHCVGNAVSGALWGMQRGLMAALGDSSAGRAKADSLWHYAGYGGAFWFDDYFLDLLVTADDDGTLLDGTPFFGEICSAFTAHGFTCPDTTSGPWIVHAPLPDSDPTASPFTVDADMGSFSAAPAPDEQKVFFRWNGGPWDEAPLSLTTGQHYQGQIPAPPTGGQVDYYLTFQDAGGLVATSPPGAPAVFHSFSIGTLSTVFADDFEVDRGWIANLGNTAFTGAWQRVDPHGTSDTGFIFQTEDDHTPPPGVKCWVTGDTLFSFPAGTADVDAGCVFLESPSWDLSGVGNAHLSFWRWFTDETSYDDTLHVELSADDGANWVPLVTQPFTQNFWKQESFDLGSVIPLTSQVRMRVRTCDNGGGSLLEAALDDVLLTTRIFSLTAAQTPGPPSRLALEGAIPQPSVGVTSIAYTLPTGTRASLRLYDARGRLVRVIEEGEFPPGRRNVVWDGMDGAGRRVAAGSYLLRLESGGKWVTGKLVLAR